LLPFSQDVLDIAHEGCISNRNSVVREVMTHVSVDPARTGIGRFKKKITNTNLGADPDN
jgi:hypothetical protein